MSTESSPRPAFETMDAAALNAWYETTVGYRPQVDSPSMTDDELRDLCRGMFDEVCFAAFCAAGFVNWHTGGGCFAWRRDLGGGTELLITESGGTGAFLGRCGDDGEPDHWLVGLYHPDIDPDTQCRKVMTVTEAIAIADELQKEKI
jgi:hypothetical protein